MERKKKKCNNLNLQPVLTRLLPFLCQYFILSAENADGVLLQASNELEFKMHASFVSFLFKHTKKITPLIWFQYCRVLPLLLSHFTRSLGPKTRFTRTVFRDCWLKTIYAEHMQCRRKSFSASMCFFFCVPCKWRKQIPAEWKKNVHWIWPLPCVCARGILTKWNSSFVPIFISSAFFRNFCNIFQKIFIACF